MSGLGSDGVRVFVSHKDEDRDIALTIKDLLEKFAPNRLEFFISGENIFAGEDWQERIKEELRKSRLLLLLFTEPTKNWDWCLFEAGLFTPLLADDDRRRIVCLYPPNSAGPRPLSNLQGVEASVETMSTFLEQFFRSDAITHITPPLNNKLSSEDIRDVANKICALFGPQKVDSYFPSFQLMLQIPRNIVLNKNTVPREAAVTGDASTLAIFGLGPGAHSWGDLVNNVGKHGLSDWVEEVGTAFNMASRRRIFRPITATFLAVDSGKIFRPFLYKLDLELDRPIAAIIAFTEELAPPDIGGPMFRLLRMSTRFADEVVAPHRGEMAELARLKGKSAALRQLLVHVEAIEHEAGKKGFDDEKTVMAYFGPNKDAKARIGRLFRKWEGIRENLNVAVEKEDLELAEGLLDEIAMLQRTFLVLAAERYYHLICEDNEDLIRQLKIGEVGLRLAK